jgi:hypothetical protein
MTTTALTAEEQRLRDARAGTPWRAWGPYLADRQWGTVREDYSDDGNAWDYFSHDQARSRAYRWGEDGLAGFSDDHSRLCLALALWNGQDPILKERLFGLTNSEGNHGEDAKEYWFHVDSTPTHSWMVWAYKYPQRAFPYDDLVRTNAERGFGDDEYQLLDTGVFDDDRYFDITVEYAKDGPQAVVMRVTAHNRGPDDAPIDLLPTLWFRNTWSWQEGAPKPSLHRVEGATTAVRADHPELGTRWLHVPHGVSLLFCDNETNTERLGGGPATTACPKDGIDRAVVQGDDSAVDADRGTKVAVRWTGVVPAGGEVSFVVRLDDVAPDGGDALSSASSVLEARRAEADEFFLAITPPSLSDDQARVMRRALAGMLWSKQHYYFDLDRWLQEHEGHPLRRPFRPGVRNSEWSHMVNDDVISMPDTWEYPWYAAWDLAFHTLPLAMVDPDFARSQLQLMLSSRYLHPTGQIPAYEWNFSDVNPPVHAWATALVHGIARWEAELADPPGDAAGDQDPFLEETFNRLLVNFTWWVNRKDPSGRNVFQGGFLGLDNIGVFDRSKPLPTGGSLEQSDGTAWMAFFAQNMLELAMVLGREDRTYAGFIVKFFRHWMQIAMAMDPLGEHPDEMWDEQAGMFFDVLRLPDGSGVRMGVRSMVGLLPLCATSVIPGPVVDDHHSLQDVLTEMVERNADLLGGIADPRVPGVDGRRLFALVDEAKLRRMLTTMLDEDQFLSPHGIRSLSRWHLDNPYIFEAGGQRFEVRYEPAESRSGMFGGNSNWRGPVWMPVNVLIVRALLQFYLYYGDSFRIECPTGSGNEMTLYEVAKDLTDRLSSLFLRDAQGRRPSFGHDEKFQSDPLWNGDVLFYEYFDGDTGAGLGASHQTGWTGAVARLMQLFAAQSAEAMLHGPNRPFSVPYRR